MIEDSVNRALSLISKKNQEIDELFLRIQTDTDDLLNNDNIDVNYETVLKIEFLFVKLRIIVVHELSSVKQILSLSDTSVQIKTIFNKREQYLLSIIQRLNELRDDIATIQRSIYTKKSLKF